ncbi:ABC transporter permease [Bifidobacterium jacchi]|uniref:ABC transporter permease n=1 Tax=Bifidobacterium jacchi TaxID=2490545 RepID=UPI001F4FAFFC|nr:ABC transporter permease [Bifidobacterium jacchi]
MGRHQRIESLGLLSFLVCTIVGAIGMSVYLSYAPAIWQVAQRRFAVCAAIVAACGLVSFTIGYASHSRSLTLKRGWFVPIRRIIEILALSIVYASTIFLSSFALLAAMNDMMGMHLFAGYLTSVCAGFCGIVGYFTLVQAELMSAKTLSSLLPFFVVAGVGTAGLTTDDPYWYHNNFSQLGDRTTFAASMFNWTLMLAGICIIIVSYFAVSELIATERMQRLLRDSPAREPRVPSEESRAPRNAADSPTSAAQIQIKSAATAASAEHNTSAEHAASTPTVTTHFALRTAILAALLTLSGLAFIGIGAFRYTPHYVMHNVCAKGLPLVMGVLFLALPWLAPRLSKALFVVSDLAFLLCTGFSITMLMGHVTLTNVEALAGLFFLGWFIVFSRQIAAIEADRVESQLAGIGIESRLAADR